LPDKDNEKEQNILTARSALLDFYADRATSFASLFVASIFGVVALLAVIQAVQYTRMLDCVILIPVSLVSYGAFAYAGHYTFHRFTFYGNIAHLLEQYGLRKNAELEKVEFEKKGVKLNLDNYLEETARRENESFFRKQIVFRWLYWGLIAFLGALVYYPIFMRVLGR